MMMITVITPVCSICGNSGTATVPEREYKLWKQKFGPIQELMPEMTIEQREQLISGTHPKCWNELFDE